MHFAKQAGSTLYFAKFDRDTDAMTTPPTQPAEGALIETARARRVPPGTSINQLAKLAGISGPRWRQVENGYSKRAGSYVREQATPETLARMAHAVHVTPKELREVECDDAADYLERILGTSDDPAPLEVTPVESGDYRGFELAIEGTPPELRAFALKLAIEAIESVKRSADQLPSKERNENQV